MKINTDDVKAIYETSDNVWPSNDMWHQHSKNEIIKCVHRMKYSDDTYLVNAGSGGSDYGLECRIMHVDIAENKINGFKEYIVSSVEKMPFQDEAFTDAICVGSVLNYCDALTAIHELFRVLKPSGSLILEFESSWGYEHRKSTAFMQDAEIVSLPYLGGFHNQWIYSPKYIRNILTTEGFQVYDEYRFHYLSGLSFSKHKDENQAARYVGYDRFCRFLPFIKKHSNNVVYCCTKL